MRGFDDPVLAVGLDGSDGATRSLHRAIDEASLMGGSLVAVHAVSPWSEVLFPLSRDAFAEWQRSCAALSVQ